MRRSVGVRHSAGVVKAVVGEGSAQEQVAGEVVHTQEGGCSPEVVGL